MQLSALSILLIEDDPQQYSILRQLVAQIPGYHVQLDWVAEPSAALALILAQNHDLVLIDCDPDQAQPSGVDLVRSARASGSQVPIILLTSTEDQRIDRTLLQAGAIDYLSKGPLLAQLLERSIRYALSQAQTMAALRVSEERYALVMRATNDGIWDWNLITDAIYFSPRWLTMIGYSEGSLPCRVETWLNRVHPDDRRRVIAEIANHRAGQTTYLKTEYRMCCRDGDYRWMMCRGVAVRDTTGIAVRMAGSQSDISARKQLEAQLMHDALHDTLTGLPNRSLFLDRLEHALKLNARHPERRFAVLFLDLDGFKIINDSLGHLIGDELLSVVARRLARCLRNSDTIARFGGDEFAILLQELGDSQVPLQIAGRIQQEIADPIQLAEHALVINASIGIALSNNDYRAGEELLRDADTAMYQAKALGRARTEIFDPAMHTRALSRLYLEADLRRAIEYQEFEIHYQPIVMLTTSQLLGFEALIRWRHPKRGLIAPIEFLPIAEETGLTIPIGEWIIGEVCRQLRVWQQQFPLHNQLTVAVNLSHKQFWHPQFIPHLMKSLMESGADPHRVRLEITEGTLLDQVEAVRQVLQQLRDLAIHVHIDDFGTGYASLESLHRFPIEALKIDRAFVNQLGHSTKCREIVRTVITLGQQLGVDVIAEGIETASQKQDLVQLQCKYGQGYFFAKPLERAAAEALLMHNTLS